MTAELALCPHLAGAAPGEPPFETSLVLDAHVGTTDAVVRCRHCAGTALLRLLDWAGPELRLRVYSLAPVAEAHVALLRRDLASGSCDLARPGRELEAFLACAGPIERILALDVHEGRLLASAPPPAGLRVPVRSWRAGLPDARDPAWFEPLGLAKPGAESATWEARLEAVQRGVRRVRVLQQSEALPYSEVLRLWQQDAGFRDWFNRLLLTAPFDAYFWETPPVTEKTLDRDFEFVFVDGPALSRLHPDPAPFESQFAAERASGEIATFPNLGGDAVLVVPRPVAPWSAYAHLVAFARHGPKSQTLALWQAVGMALGRRVGEKPVWVSTAGLGVSWLHVRLDSRPKYYRFVPYQRAHGAAYDGGER